MAKTVVGLFDDAAEAQSVVQDLVALGVARANISVMAARSEDTVRADVPDDDGANVVAGAGIGAALGGIGGLLVGLAVLPIPGLGPVIAAGPIATTLAGVGIGAATGSVLGAMAEIGVPAEHAHYYAEGMRRGATFVSAGIDESAVERVTEVMSRHNAVDIHERAAEWRQSGWSDEATLAKARVHMSATPTRPDGTREAIQSLRVGKAVVTPRLSAERVEEPVMVLDTRAPRRSYEDYDNEFRGDYHHHYGLTGLVYGAYQPAYRYGYDLANDPRFASRDWPNLELDARREWDKRPSAGPWERFRNAVRHAFERVRSEQRASTAPNPSSR